MKKLLASAKIYRLIIVIGLAAAILGGLQSNSPAAIISFTRITSNAATDVAGQLSAIVTSVDANYVKFEFHNSAVIASSITTIYFDDGGPTLPSILDNLSSIVDYQTLFEIGAQPGNLPGGNTLTPDFSADFAAQAKNQPPTMITNGVDNATDYVGLVFLLKPDVNSDDVTAALDSGWLRIGLHVQAIDGGTSDSFVSVPEPATICILAIGALSLIRRKK